MAAGIERLGAGELSVLGESPSHTLMSSVAYMADRPNLLGFDSVGQLIKYYKDFFPDFRPSVISGILPELGITEKDKIKFISPTALRKLQLSLTMSRAARLYLLDEPTAWTIEGSAEFVSRVIMANCPESSTVVVASSQIADVEYMLDDFFFITYGGRILLSGSARVAREGSGRSLAELAREVY
jgi:ABC-2 type transport system ATP-binding protein